MADPVPWTFATGGDYSEQYDWLTEVLNARTGGSQHRRLRQSPRTTLAFSSLERGRNRRWMDQQLRANSAKAWDAPVSMDTRQLAAAAAVDDTVLSVGVAAARFVVGGRVLLRGEDPRRFEVRVIDAIGSNSLTLDEGLVFAWPVGTELVPVRRARFAEVPRIDRFTSDDSGLVDLRFRLEEALAADDTFPGASYRGLPVFDFIAPVWTSDPAWLPERATDTVDNEIAVPFVTDLAGVPLGRTTMQYAPDSPDRIAAFRSALFALAGRWAPAWVPTWCHDLRVVANVPAGALTLDVEGPLLAGMPLPDNRRDIRIELHGGTVLYRRIASVAAPSSSVDRLTLDAALPAFTASQVKMACFVVLSAQDSDTNLLRFFGPDVAQCELAWRELDHAL